MIAKSKTTTVRNRDLYVSDLNWTNNRWYEDQNHKKPSYRRESAHLTLLYHTVQKAFRYVEPGHHRELRNVSISRTSSSILHSFSVTSANIAINDIHVWLKTRFFGPHFCRRQYRSAFNHFDVIGPNSTQLNFIVTYLQLNS